MLTGTSITTPLPCIGCLPCHFSVYMYLLSLACRHKGTGDYVWLRGHLQPPHADCSPALHEGTSFCTALLHPYLYVQPNWNLHQSPVAVAAVPHGTTAECEDAANGRDVQGLSRAARAARRRTRSLWRY
jgi:hypothetical protein